MLNLLRKIIPERSPVRLTYHKLSAMAAAAWYGFPAKKIKVVGITGTSGKSSTVEILHAILHSPETPCGAISSIQIHIGANVIPNHSLRTTLRPWKTQKLLRKMYKSGCQTAILEVSSHALDQNRLWGVNFHTAVLTNIFDNEHLDYHKTLEDYVESKRKLFQAHPKVICVNAEAEFVERFTLCKADKTITFARKDNADLEVLEEDYSAKGFTLEVSHKNEKAKLTSHLLGTQNAENVLAAVSVARAHNIDFEAIKTRLEKLKAIPGRLETIKEGQPFTVLVDHTYKPSALSAVLKALKAMTKGRVIIVWGGAGGRDASNWEESAQIIDELADEFILTTDDPYKEDPVKIAKIIRDQIKKKSEGQGFFEIDDRYEAMRYAIFSARKDDIVLIAGRGIEVTQTIGKKTIPFDDRHVAREILHSANRWELPNL